ncbi:T9SS type A sorting domain-containing protein [Chryseobacterium sp. MP_3.2]|uniref:T9SS type A sorting domain-containing protein n=1 Tax=Chryseobacterium sp. MP_3.2 TaxID=3071712 RepID=UPI002E0BA6F4|nr:hypothetical protein [Chryseobacterium sp. MP_3.2]
MLKQLLTLLILPFAVYSNAQIILRQDFSTLNVGKLDGQNGWTNNSSAGGTGGAISGAEFVSVSADALSYPNYGNATKSITMKGVDQDGPGHLLATPITAGTYYFSFLGNFSAYPTGTNYFDVLRMLNGGAFTTSARIWVQPGSTAAGFKVGIKIGDSTNPAGVTSSDYAFNQTHLFVVKYVIGPGSSDDIMNLFIDPVFASGEPATSTLSAPLGTFEYSNNIDRVAFPYNTPKAGKATGKIGLVSIARTWDELDFPETLDTGEFNTHQNAAFNYANGNITIQQTGYSNADLNITAVDGKLVYSTKLNSKKIQQFSVGKLQKGIYFYTLENGSKTINKKFIINN